jgi:hypothetical protein
MFSFNPMPKHGYVMDETTSPARKRWSIIPKNSTISLLPNVPTSHHNNLHEKWFPKATLAADKEP